MAAHVTLPRRFLAFADGWRCDDDALEPVAALIHRARWRQMQKALVKDKE